MRVINHNLSATKQRLHPQSVAEISRHSVRRSDLSSLTCVSWRQMTSMWWFSASDYDVTFCCWQPLDIELHDAQSWTYSLKAQVGVIGGVLPGFVTGIHKDSVRKWNHSFPSAGVFAEVLAGGRWGRRLPPPTKKSEMAVISTMVNRHTIAAIISTCSSVASVTARWLWLLVCTLEIYLLAYFTYFKRP